MKHFGICVILLWPMPLISAGIPLSGLELRIVLLGKSRAGNSATGNTILGKNVFKENSFFDSATSVSHNESGRVFGRQITVVDTPGLFAKSKTPDELKSEIEKCVNMSVPGPHVFLLVIRLGVRFTEEEKNAVKWIQENFGKRAAEFTMVLFTHADQLKGESVEHTFNKDIRNLIDSCGGGYHSFNNLEQGNQTQVEELLEKIDALVEKNDGEHYTNEMYQEAQSKIQEEERKRQKEEKKRKEYQRKIREDERKQAEEDFRKAEEERKKQGGFGAVLGRWKERFVGGLEAGLGRLMKVAGLGAGLGISKKEEIECRWHAGGAAGMEEEFGQDDMDRFSSCCRCNRYMLCCGQRREG